VLNNPAPALVEGKKCDLPNGFEFMAVNLPMELLRSFVAINETGSMQQATKRVFVTQSALSLQMRRLEDIVRQPLFNRQGRKLSLSQAGAHVLSSAKQILEMNDRLFASLQGQALSGHVRVGLNQDFAEIFLPGVLNEFVTLYPEIQLQVCVGGSQELLEALETGAMDVVFCVRAETEPQNIKIIPMQWVGQVHLLEQDVLPLALLEEPCLFRATALRLLEESGRKFRIVVETASLSVIRAAVQAGLAITCRNQLFVESGLLPVLPGNGLPVLPTHGYALFTGAQPSPAALRLADLISQSVTMLE
jgi:DNA-binding transcriptional LysR family regulator